MVFSEGKVGSGGEGGGGLMKPATGGSDFGLLTEPSVLLHAMNSSEYVHSLTAQFDILLIILHFHKFCDQ